MKIVPNLINRSKSNEIKSRHSLFRQKNGETRMLLLLEFINYGKYSFVPFK